jgi:pimeloyl-ACP methyl ester carboxylesterase
MKKIVAYLFAFIFLSLLVFYAIPVKKRGFAELYGKGDPAVARSLAAFRETPTKTLSDGGLEWHYLVRGEGPRNLLFLHGMGGAADIWWQQIGALQSDFRIISITMPTVHSLEEAAAGINHILEAEKVDRLSIVGTSMGGYIAQYFLSQFPERIEKAVFGNTFPPNEIYREQNGGLRKLVPWLPEWLVMSQFRSNISKTVSPASGYSKLVEAYLLEQYSGLMSKQQFIGRFDIVLDSFAINRAPDRRAVPKLIIESDNDPLVYPELRSRLKQAYPEAQVFTFSGKGHFPYLNEPGDYTETLSRFLID